jgi:hypothetical protein
MAEIPNAQRFAIKIPPAFLWHPIRIAGAMPQSSLAETA